MTPEAIFAVPRECRVRRLRKSVRSFVDLCGDKDQSGAVSGQWWMVTLTYEHDKDKPSRWGYSGEGWKPRHISDYLTNLRKWGQRRRVELAFVWVAELQRRGVIHYHVLVKAPSHLSIPKPDKQGWWRHGRTGRERVKKSARGYAAKYYSKMSQRLSAFPAHARIFGCGGLPSWAALWQRWITAPQYIRGECNPADNPRRCSGGWRVGSQFIPSPWVGTFIPGRGCYLRRKSPEEWTASVGDIRPHKTYLLRQDAFRRVGTPFADDRAAWVEAHGPEPIDRADWDFLPVKHSRMTSSQLLAKDRDKWDAARAEGWDTQDVVAWGAEL